MNNKKKNFDNNSSNLFKNNNIIQQKSNSSNNIVNNKNTKINNNMNTKINNNNMKRNILVIKNMNNKKNIQTKSNTKLQTNTLNNSKQKKEEYFNLDKVKDKFKNNSLNFLIAIIIFIVFYIIGKLIKMKYDSYKENDIVKNKIFYDFIGNLLYYIIIIIGLIIALIHVGFNISTILVCLGSLGIAIALSIQSTITQLISGIFILVFDLYNINDIVEVNNVKGHVKDFTLFQTTLSDQSKQDIIIPNNIFLSSIYKNYTKEDVIKTAVIVSISSNNSIDYDTLIFELKNKIKETSKYCVDKNNISISINDISDSGTKLIIRVPVNSKEIFNAESEIKIIVRTVLSKDNILLLDNSYITS